MAFKLDPGAEEVRALDPEARHDYIVAVSAGDYVRVVADQRGIDVALELFPPGAENPIVKVDTPGGDLGPERLAFVAESGGDWRLAVVAGPDPQDPEARYALRIEERRPATARDRREIDGARALTAGDDARKGDAVDAYDRAEARFLEALEIALEIGDARLEAAARQRIGWVRLEKEETASAVAELRLAVELGAKLDDALIEAQAANDLGDALADDWQLAAAEQAFLQGRDAWQRLGRPGGLAAALHGLANVYRDQGRHDDARATFEQALAVLRQVKEFERAPREASISFSFGELYLSRSQLTEARDVIDRALVLYRGLAAVEPGFWKGQESDCEAKLGEIAAVQGDLEGARRHFENAARLAQDVDPVHEVGLAIAENGLGDALIRAYEKAPEAGTLELAHSSLASARARFVALDDRYGEAIAVMNLGRVARAGGDLVAAAQLHDESLAIFDGLGVRQGVASNLYGLASASLGNGDLADARLRIDAALSEIEGVRGASVGVDSRTAYFASRQDYFDLDLAIHLAERDAEPHGEAVARAFAASERRRARGLLDLLGEAEGGLRRQAPSTLLDAERAARQELDAIDDRRRALVDSGAPAERLEEVEREQRAALARLETARIETRRKSPHRALFALPETVDLDGARALLDERTALLAYALGADRSALWVVDTQGIRAFHVLPKRDEIERLGRRAAELFARPDAGSEAPRREAGIALAEAILPAAALRDLEVERLVVIADGALDRLPFAALPDLSRAATDPPPLVERFEFASVPSASTLSVLRRGLGRRLPVLGGIAMVADPVYSLEDPRLAHRGEPGVAAAGRYGRLPATADEAAAILERFPPAHRFLASGFAADRDLVLGGGLRGFRFVHFATHARVDSERPELSGLALSAIDADGRPRPRGGELRLHEIYDLDLPAELVVLSACSTGLGRETRAEGIEGLARGFFYAGAPRLVLSLWPVEDAGTANFMTEFYRALIDGREGPAAALRTAQRKQREDPRYRDPYHWASFVFIGDWQFPGAAAGNKAAAEGQNDPIERLYTGGPRQRPRPHNPLPGPKPKPKPKTPPPVPAQGGPGAGGGER